MKKTIKNLTLLFIISLFTTNIVFAQNKSDFLSDHELFVNQIEKKTEDYINETSVNITKIDSLVQEAKANGKPINKEQITILIKKLDDSLNNLKKYYDQINLKLKTKAYKNFTTNTMSLIKIKHEFTHEMLSLLLKTGEIDKDRNAEIINKYGPRLEKINKEIINNTKEIKSLMEKFGI